MPILGLQNSSLDISSQGIVKYPIQSIDRLGVFNVYRSDFIIPQECNWVVTSIPHYVKPRENISVILNWYYLHPPYEPFNPFESESQIKEVEDKLRSVPTENFWGIIFICEEHYRTHISFDDTLDTTWFGERLLGYRLYLAEKPDASKDDWTDEMYLRMIRGFYNYFHPLTEVGITATVSSIVTGWKNISWAKGIPYFFGEPAMAFIREHFDFVILYAYTENLEDFEWTKRYFSTIDQFFQKQKKFWILTRMWEYNKETWEREAIALEIKNCLERNIVVTSYYWTEPPLQETWFLMNKAVELYDTKAPYFEEYANGENLLTGYVGNTYGWVRVLG